jgi:hypothetical protein
MTYKQLQTATNNDLQTTTNSNKQLQTMTYKQLQTATNIFTLKSQQKLNMGQEEMQLVSL